MKALTYTITALCVCLLTALPASANDLTSAIGASINRAIDDIQRFNSSPNYKPTGGVGSGWSATHFTILVKEKAGNELLNELKRSCGLIGSEYVDPLQKVYCNSALQTRYPGSSLTFISESGTIVNGPNKATFEDGWLRQYEELAEGMQMIYSPSFSAFSLKIFAPTNGLYISALIKKGTGSKPGEGLKINDVNLPISMTAELAGVYKESGVKMSNKTTLRALEDFYWEVYDPKGVSLWGMAKDLIQDSDARDMFVEFVQKNVAKTKTVAVTEPTKDKEREEYERLKAKYEKEDPKPATAKATKGEKKQAVKKAGKKETPAVIAAPLAPAPQAIEVTQEQPKAKPVEAASSEKNPYKRTITNPIPFSSLTVAENTPELAEQIGIPFRRSLVVVNVQPPNECITPGAVITKIGKQTVATLESYERESQRSDQKVLVDYETASGPHRVYFIK